MFRIITRSLIILICIFCFIVLLSPFVALFLPKDFRNHTYAELVYQVIADEETKDCHSIDEKVEKLFNYVRENIVFGGSPYKGKPLDYLITGRGYCDYQARTLNSLLGRLNIASRYAMLKDKDGISPHTFNEVLINDKWAIYDTTFNIIFRNQEKYLQVIDLRNNPGLIELVINDATLAEDWKQMLRDVLKRTLPFEASWSRSTPRIEQYHIVDYLIGLYKKIFGMPFANFYQDCYLKVSLKEVPNEDERVFLKARNYHLFYREDLAEKHYRGLIEFFPESKYKENCLAFLESLKG